MLQRKFGYLKAGIIAILVWTVLLVVALATVSVQPLMIVVISLGYAVGALFIYQGWRAGEKLT